MGGAETTGAMGAAVVVVVVEDGKAAAGASLVELGVDVEVELGVEVC